ncbi:hypothetical protein PYCCODRAFT_1480052 [Trametes coccinea BRFM310]|uniref:TOG domain-containing protein n=1 Tax=Trametes coccinea (strain BRFM310) TaxID=1353009 RepID=A0A1Y2IEU9_TRAC3|nr:hypothetical protein PYCCODRAFT_1480052 [Trametes coccinea BRFM310]
MDDSPVRRLVNQCRSNDIDARIDAITKLQAEFEAGSEIPEPDALIQAVKACLRTPNQHLTTATLSALPPLIPLLVTRPPAQIPLPSSSTSPAASTSSATSSPIDSHAMRQVLTQLMPAGGGVIDRLGDSKEKPRDKARETLVVMGGFAFRCGGPGASTLRSSRDGKGPETPMQLFERFLKEGGLASKVWRVREQAILVLVHIRRTHHMFPLRPYLPFLVDALEDTDSTVRECAKQSVVELFTGPGVTDAARADLKKELAKKGVRKTIADSVLTRVLAGGTTPSTPAAGSDAGSENGDGTAASKEYVPPSIALMNRRPGGAGSGGASSAPVSRAVSQGNVRELSRPASRAAVMTPTGEGPSAAAGGTEVKPVYIASSRDLENEFASMLPSFEGKETEHNWMGRDQAIQRVRGMLKGDVLERYPDTFLHGLKNGFMEASLKTLASLRTTVAGNTCALYSELAIALGPALDPFCEMMYTNLIRMANLTKKITAQTSQATVTTLIQHTSPLPKLILPLLWNVLQDKAIQTRQYAVGHVKTYIEVHGARATHAIEASGGIDVLEKIVKKALGDPNAGVRDNARQLFWTFQAIWGERGAAILQSLDTTSRKQLEKACPSPEQLAAVPTVSTSPPKVKKSSVAAAIAASRAKAKAIANAPPTLRHQATSTSHTIRATSPPTKRATSPSLSTSSSTGGVRAQSPISRSSPPRSRIVSTGTLSRSVSAGVVSSQASRSPPRQPHPASPPSPTPDQTYRRRLSSPLTSLHPSPPTSNSTFRKAVETALPASPPSSVITFTSPTPRPQKAGHPTAVPVQRDSLSLAGLRQLAGTEEESLLLATNIPIPEDSDSDMELDESVNLISFSTPYEVYPPVPRSNSQANSFSPKSTSSKPTLSNALSTGTSSPPAGVAQPLVEDAMRARAEQAESAAERLLELVEPEEDGVHPSPIPASLLLRNTEGSKPRSRVSGGSVAPTLPRTPISKRSAAIMQQAALFQDSPVQNGKTTSLFDMVDGRDRAGQWWAKRMALLKMAAPSEDVGTPDREETVNTFIVALEDGTADISVLKKLARLCSKNPSHEPLSPVSPGFSAPLTPSPMNIPARPLESGRVDYWAQDKLFDRLFSALVKFLDPHKNAEELEYGLIVLWEMLENQAPLLEGREADIFSLLLQIRYCAQMTVMQATNLFRDTLTSRIEPVYGLTTLHACLRAFRDTPPPPSATTEIRDGTYAFGLIALGKFFLRLPAEVLEEELPRLRSTLISALTESSGTNAIAVREAATAATIAAQMVLRDETHLFTLLDGLPDEKKNLLAYMFDKHGTRGPASATGPSAMEKLEREMRRIDGRLSTPGRSGI